MIDSRINGSKIMAFVLLIGCLAMMLVAPVQTSAKETAKSDFINGENKVELTDEKTVIVQNDSQHSTISIKENGKEVFSKELAAVKVASIERVNIGDQQYSIIMYRYNGSANALFFEVLQLKDAGVESIYISEVYERARIHLNKNEIMLEYPEYNQDDVMTEPSKIVNQEFSIVGNKVIEGNKDTEKTVVTRDARGQKASLSGTNPSNGKINKILTEEALKAGISPEILKAIAFQESGWRQYWTDVPDYAKRCDIYDGSNVVLGYDCIGIGIMQISDYRFLPDGPDKEDYIDRLKTDIRFNITEGIETLKAKWGYGGILIPTINNNDPMVIENWYFAVLAYNGMLPRNNPIENAYTAYQEKVFDRLEDYSLLDLNPFPTYKLNPYQLKNGQMRFDNQNVTVKGPQHLSSQSLEDGDKAYVTVNGLNFRKSPSGKKIGELAKGTKVAITGSFVANNSRVGQYVWLPIRTSSGKAGWVASSYLNPTNKYLGVYELEGENRYMTSVSIANHGWHFEQPSSVVIGRGDVPIDALTGSVLASVLDSPLLLTKKNQLTASVEKELDRLNPKKVYILGGSKAAISAKVERTLNSKFGKSNVIRISGANRYETAYNVATKVRKHKVQNELFITTGDESSSDALAIAPHAGEKGIPVLLTRKGSLDNHIQNYIKKYGVNKVTIIGGKNAISSNVESTLNSLVGAGNVSRVYGDTRYSTSTAIVNKYYNTNSVDKLFIAQGLTIADALSASPFASKLEAPIILTKSDQVPREISKWINQKITAKPNVYFLGGPSAISKTTRNQLINTIK